MNKLVIWFRKVLEHSRRVNEAKRKALLQVEAENIIQVREFNGKLFVCYRDIPLVEESQLNNQAEITAKTVRAAAAIAQATGAAPANVDPETGEIKEDKKQAKTTTKK